MLLLILLIFSCYCCSCCFCWSCCFSVCVFCCNCSNCFCCDLSCFVDYVVYVGHVVFSNFFRVLVEIFFVCVIFLVLIDFFVYPSTDGCFYILQVQSVYTVFVKCFAHADIYSLFFYISKYRWLLFILRGEVVHKVYHECSG